MDIGAKIGGVCLLNQNNENIDLESYLGKWVVLYFYPKDSTPGCTQEAKEFSAAKDEFDKEGAIILGVSGDSTASHKKFETKQELTINLLSDEEHGVLEKFGVWGEKSMMGRKYMGIFRTTFLIGPDGEIKHKWEKVKVAGHVDDVLKKLKEFK